MKLHEDRPTFGSMLLASADPGRLERWYGELFEFGNIPVLFDKRDEIVAEAVEPTRLILNFHVNDARAACAKLDSMRATWISPLEQRENGMWFATTVDPDGNYVQIIQVVDEVMLQDKPNYPFPGFSTDKPEETQAFYRDVLGFRTLDMGNGFFSILFGNNTTMLCYPKGNDHQPATYTALNIPVDDIEAEVDKLAAKGVEFHRFDMGDGMAFDKRNIMRGGSGKGPDMAWFNDPGGNTLALMHHV